MSLSLTESSSDERVFRFLESMDPYFTPPLSKRVELKPYSRKLAEGAINYFLVFQEIDVAHVAFYCGDPDCNTAYISSIGVLPGYQRLGIADKLIGYVVEHCSKEGKKILELEVEPGNKKAISFYIKNGFSFYRENYMRKILGYS